MESDSDRGLIRVLEAYVTYLGSVAPIVTYLLFLTAAIIGGWATTLAFALFGPTPLAFALLIASFAVSFTLAGYVLSVLFRVADSYEMLRLSGEARATYAKTSRRRGTLLGLGWFVPFVTLIPASYYFIPWPYTIAVAISLGVGIGNVVTALVNRAYGIDYVGGFFAGLYLVLTTPL